MTMCRSRPSSCAYAVCSQCQMPTPQVYSQGWMCLYPDCSLFWMMVNGNYPEGQLSYNADFLALRPLDGLPVDLLDLRPDLPPTEVPNDVTTTYNFTRGWHCRSCGRLSCRYASSFFCFRSVALLNIIMTDINGSIGNVRIVV